jgi:hypothetical protein
MTKKESLIQWAKTSYRRQHRGKEPLLAVNASTSAANHAWLRALKLTKPIAPGIFLKGWEMIRCPLITPVSDLVFDNHGKRTFAKIGSTTGAYHFTFEAKGKSCTALYVCWEHGYKPEMRAIAVFPFGQIQVWHQLEQALVFITAPKPTHKKAYIIGSGYQSDFKPTVTLADVILPADLKEQLLINVDEFFRTGITAYQEMGVPAFRKYLLYGDPGNGKSMLAMALAADQLTKRRVVVFVSASNKQGADFNKLHQALEIARTNKFPVFVVVEEVDAYVTDPAMRAQVLDVLDGFEAPNNPKGSLLLMTSNHPERLDEAILRFGRVDQRWRIPSIETAEDARQLFQRYLGERYEPEIIASVARRLIGRPRVFVRELSFIARLKAATAGDTHLAGHLTATLRLLEKQALDGESFLREGRSPLGFEHAEVAEQDEFPF